MNNSNVILKAFGPGKYLFINCDTIFVDCFTQKGINCSKIQFINNEQLSIEDTNKLNNYDKFDYVILDISEFKTNNPLDELLSVFKIKDIKGLYIFNKDDRPQELYAKLVEICCYNNGFVKHSAYYEFFTDYNEDNSSDKKINLIMQPLSLNRGEYDEEMEVPILRLKWKMDVHTILCNYIRPGDRVLELSSEKKHFDGILRNRSKAREVISPRFCPEMILKKDIKCSASESEEDLHVISLSLADEKFDFIILDNFDTPLKTKNIELLSKILTPGGRIVFIFKYATSQSKEEIIQKIENEFEIEEFYLDSTSSLNENSHIKKINFKTYNSRKELVDENKVCILVAMKSPFSDEVYPYVESVYGYCHPPENLLAFERDYNNPWLIRSMVEFPFRNRNPKVLRNYAEKVIDLYPFYSADVGAALAILGYQELSDTSKHDASEYIKSLCLKIEQYSENLDTLNPHQERWQISLLFLKGLLLRKIGERTRSLATFIAVSKMDCFKFSPTLGTKILLANYEAAMILASDDEIPKAISTLQEGINVGIKLLSAEPTEIFGNISSPHAFTLFIYQDILDILIKITNAKKYLIDKPALIFKENSNTWSSLLMDRMDAINNIEKMYINALHVSSEKDLMLEDRLKAIEDMDRMIFERDNTILSMSEMANERYNSMLSMNTMIAERDEEISRLKAKIHEFETTSLTKRID